MPKPGEAPVTRRISGVMRPGPESAARHYERSINIRRSWSVPRHRERWQPRAVLTPLDRYAFDTRGYLVFDSVLSRVEVDRLREVITRRGVAGGTSVNEQRFGWHGQLLTWDQGFRDLIDHPLVVDLLRTFIGAHVRLDHAYGIVMPPHSRGLGLHGPDIHFDAAYYYGYRGGEPRCGLLAFSWALVDAPERGGGFGCIPGSHRAEEPLPGNADSLVQLVPQSAGSLLVFTEALAHCTMPWNGDAPRFALLYKYAPATMQVDVVPAMAREHVGLLTARQRRLVEPPSRIGRADSI